jgi:hypothetical protein
LKSRSAAVFCRFGVLSHARVRVRLLQFAAIESLVSLIFFKMFDKAD